MFSITDETISSIRTLNSSQTTQRCTFPQENPSIPHPLRQWKTIDIIRPKSSDVTFQKLSHKSISIFHLQFSIPMFFKAHDLTFVDITVIVEDLADFVDYT